MDEARINGVGLVPPKRRTPLKRYLVQASLDDGDTCYLVVRARNKKNARWFTLQTYTATDAQVLECLGRSREEEYIEYDDVSVCIWLHSGYTHYLPYVTRKYLLYVVQAVRAGRSELVTFTREEEDKEPVTLNVRDIRGIEEVD